jgi:hypothetical protein
MQRNPYQKILLCEKRDIPRFSNPAPCLILRQTNRKEGRHAAPIQKCGLSNLQKTT